MSAGMDELMDEPMEELMDGIYPGSTSARGASTTSEAEDRQLLTVQILSLGFNLDDDPEMQNWSNAEMQELLNAFVVSGSDDLDDEVTPTAGDFIARPRNATEEGKPTIIPDRMTIEKQIPGYNDLMSGALPSDRQRRYRSQYFSGSPTSCKITSPYDPLSDSDLDDSTISLDTLPSLYRSMPHYMISAPHLRTLHLFSNPHVVNILPPNFFTTVKGLKRAWDEANSAVADPDDEDMMDQALLDAVIRRGGTVQDSYSKVRYPANIVPCGPGGADGDRDFWQELAGIDGGDERGIQD